MRVICRAPFKDSEDNFAVCRLRPSRGAIGGVAQQRKPVCKHFFAHWSLRPNRHVRPTPTHIVVLFRYAYALRGSPEGGTTVGHWTRTGESLTIWPPHTRPPAAGSVHAPRSFSLRSYLPISNDRTDRKLKDVKALAIPMKSRVTPAILHVRYRSMISNSR
jgi:hypothetical protein